jgi:fumarylacetoacetase
MENFLSWKGGSRMQAAETMLRSWVPVPAESHFPIQNLPYGVFRRPGVSRPAVGVAIGEYVLDVTLLEEAGWVGGPQLRRPRIFDQGCLNPLLALGRPVWEEVRATLQRLLRADEPTLRDHPTLREHALVPQKEVELLLPVQIGDYTDFYASRQHATNLGIMMRGPEQPLLPNWVHLPVAYHGRASSVVVSGTNIHRPWGQTKPDDAATPRFGPSSMLDLELELGAIIGPGNPLGHPIPIATAAEHLFGLVLVNDWSARDIQRWEYQPLGPFLSKNFATSLSPWVVPLAALEPFRVPGPVQEPTPLPYLRCTEAWNFDIQLEVWLQTPALGAPVRLCATNARHLYWNFCQQIAHHTSNGCNLRPGDLLASGTISGPTADSFGSLVELSWRGSRPVSLPSGEQRCFLEDGDTVILTGWCQGPGYRVGFGEVRGTILPALSQ